MEAMHIRQTAPAASRVGLQNRPSFSSGSDCWQKVPVLVGQRVVLREVHAADAASLYALLTTDEVARFIHVPPASVEDFARFISRAQLQRAAGTGVCFAVTRKGTDSAV